MAVRRWRGPPRASCGSAGWGSARALSGPLGRPRTWQLLDVMIGLVMFTLAVVLVRS